MSGNAALRIKRRAGRVLLVGGALLGLAFMAFPLVVIISVSFTETAYLRFPPEGFSLEWYRVFLRDPSYIGSIWLSAYLALSATAGALVLGVPAALVISRVEFPGRGAVAAFFLSPLVLPVIVIGAAILQLASALGFARTFWAMLAGHIVIVLPYIVRTTLASLTGMRKAFEEAAQDLGARPMTVFYQVTLPQIKPGIVARSIFAMIISWINVELSIFNTTAHLLPLPVKLFNYIQYNVDPSIAAVSAATIYVAIVVVVVMDLAVGIDKVAAGR